MSISSLTIPRLLPITGSFVLPLSAYYLALQTRVVYHRLKNDKYIEQESSSSEHDVLRAATRAQMNFAENVPLALALAAIVELNGGSRKALTWALSALTMARILHAEAGLMIKDYQGWGRAPGYFGTQGVIAGLAGYAAYLVKGYWEL